MDSDTTLHHLNLIDLLNERHRMMQKITEQAWNDQNNMQITHSEWYIIARIYKKRPTISYITKNVDISRQAIHKIIKNLSAKSLVEIGNLENNKKEKWIELTAYGEKCYEENEALKATLEEKIAEKIGVDQVKKLKGILQSDWGLEDSNNK